MISGYRLHLLWSVAALGAFTLGYVVSEKRRHHQLANATQGTELKPGASLLDGTRRGAAQAHSDQNDADNRLMTPSALAFGEALTDETIAALGERFKTSTDPIQRRLAFARLLDGLTAENALLIREQLEHLDGDTSEFREFHYAWGAVGGEDAVVHGADTPQRDMASTLAGWASADPDAALKWLAGAEEDKKRYDKRSLQFGLIHGLSNRDPKMAADHVFALAADGEKEAEGLLGVVTSKVLRTDGASEAAEWAEALPSGALRASAMDRVAHEYVAKDPQAAAAWAERFVNEEHSARIIEEVGDEWAERDPVASIGWLETLEHGEGKSDAFSSALGEWASKDPTAASEYLATMPSDAPERDAAIGGFVGRLAWEDPASAIAWAGEIQDTNRQQSVLIRAGQAFHRRDPTGAAEWLPNSGLSAEAQQKVLNGSRRR